MPEEEPRRIALVKFSLILSNLLALFLAIVLHVKIFELTYRDRVMVFWMLLLCILASLLLSVAVAFTFKSKGGKEFNP